MGNLRKFYDDWEKGKPFPCGICGARAESLFQTADGPVPVCDTACADKLRQARKAGNE